MMGNMDFGIRMMELIQKFHMVKNYTIENNFGEFLRVGVDEDNDGYGDQSGIIDRNGNCIVDPVYTQVYYDERNEVFFVRKDTEADDDYIIEDGCGG